MLNRESHEKKIIDDLSQLPPQRGYKDDMLEPPWQCRHCWE